MDELVEVLIVISFFFLTFWQAPKLKLTGGVLYLLSGGLAVFYGSSWVDASDVTLLAEGIIIMVFGIYCFYLAMIKFAGG